MKIKMFYRPLTSKLSSIFASVALFSFFALAAQTASATRIISLSGDLNFGNVAVGSSAQLTFTISNSGSQNMVVQSIDYPTGFAGDFLSGPIHPGESQIVTVTFTPTAVQSYGGTIIVNCNKTSGENTISTSGNGIPPAETRIISLSGDLNFGSVIVNTSAQQTFSITNSGNSTLTVSDITYPPGFSGDFSSGTIAAGAVQNVAVTFSPTTADSYGGTVTISSDATGGTNTFAIVGAGIDATRIISLSGDLTFGNVTVGSSAQLTLAITNTGNTTLNVSSIIYPTGFSGDFSGVIEPGGTTNVIVTFAPTDAIAYSDTVTVNSDATSGINTVNASGTGTAVPAPAISLSGNLDFGTVTIGSSAQLTLTINNTGTATLTVSSIGYPTGFSGDFSGTVTVGETTNVTVTFSPTDATSYSGTITVNSDAASGTNTINASGTGTAGPTPAISLSGDLDFGDVTVGSSAQLTLTITNTGTAILTVSSINYPTGFSGDFSGTIATGETTNVIVTFSPIDVTTYSGTVTVNSDAASGVNTVNASGTGAAVPTPAISLSGDLSFGNVTVGSSAQLTLNITNTGTANLTVSSVTYPIGFSGDFSGVIAAGETTNVTVTFSPTDATDYSGTITVNSDATSGANTVSASGTGIEAPLPYVARKARFNGLFNPEGGVAFNDSGYFSALTTTKGIIRATIRLAGKRYPYRGVLSPNGQSSGTIVRKGFTPLAVSLEIHGDVLSGTISDGIWTADLLADRNPFNARTNLAPQAGTYTVTILGSPDALQAPTTNGVGKITVRTSGVVKFSGKLGDGKKVSQSTTLSANGQWPLFGSLYSRKGLILGWVNLEGNDVNGSVIWIKPPQLNDTNYPAGFSFETTLVGTRD
jgi:uncharacterized membrane protein